MFYLCSKPGGISHVVGAEPLNFATVLQYQLIKGGKVSSSESVVATLSLNCLRPRCLVLSND